VIIYNLVLLLPYFSSSLNSVSVQITCKFIWSWPHFCISHLGPCTTCIQHWSMKQLTIMEMHGVYLDGQDFKIVNRPAL